MFFLSVGLLIDIKFFFEHLGTLLVVFILATVAKGLINVVALRISGQPWEQSVIAGVTLGQIGEFAFVIASVGLTVGAIDNDGYKIAVAVIALSLMLGPIWVALERRLRAAEDLGERLSAAEETIRSYLNEKFIELSDQFPKLRESFGNVVVDIFRKAKSYILALYSNRKG